VSKLLRRLAQNSAALGALLLLSCGGSDLTLPSESSPAAISIQSGRTQNGTAGDTLQEPLIVKVVDRRGEPVVHQRVAFGIDPNVTGAEVTPDIATTNEEGLATAEWVLGAVTGTQTARATVVGMENLNVTFEAIVDAGPAQRLEYVSGDDQTAAVGTGLPQPLAVRVTDAFGNPVADIEVQWDAENGSVDPSSSLSGSDGLARTSWVLGSSTGTQSATASRDQLEGSPVGFTATAVPGTASRLVQVSGNNQSGPADQELSSPLVVRLVDQDGNGVPGRAVTWVIGTGGGSVSSATNTTDGNGEAQVRWSLGSGLGLNTVNAVVSGVGVVSFRATATSGGGGGGGGGGGATPSRLRFLTQPSDVEKDQRISPAVEVEVLDQNGNRVTDADVEIKLELSGDEDGELKGKDKQRTSSGVATFDDIKVDKEGEYRLHATADGFPTVESNSFDVRERDRD
jgi:protocatechuate 3,4-dioxygenase beta subunit